MPDIEFTPDELRLVDDTMEELDPLTHELTRDLHHGLTDHEWSFLLHYVRREIRSALKLGLLARAVARVATELGAADEAGAQSYLRSVSWLRNFGVTDGLDERFLDICGDSATDSALFIAVESLLELARDRMFNTIDEEYRLLLERST